VLALPALPSLDLVRARLDVVFPPHFPDRTPLISEMCASLVFVCKYGNFIEGTGNWFRPSTVIRFSEEQAAKTLDEDRARWAASCQNPGFEPLGKQWYADNSREPLRDDLIRNRAMPIGIIVKREGVPPTSPAPIYAISKAFAALFDPSLTGSALGNAIDHWQEHHLDQGTLKRMRLLAQGVTAKQGQVTVTLPNSGITLRLAPGEASHITKDVCEKLAVDSLRDPLVVHVSMSDRKSFPELKGATDAVGLKFDAKAELPDVVMVNLYQPQGKGMTVVFVEVVHSDGPITELRKKALLRIAKDAGIPEKDVVLVTAFEDRNSPAYKKRTSELAFGSWVWFRSEPHLFMHIGPMRKLDE
jgi:hypothetical protein